MERAVADGAFVTLAPQSAGQHTTHFTASLQRRFGPFHYRLTSMNESLSKKTQSDKENMMSEKKNPISKDGKTMRNKKNVCRFATITFALVILVAHVAPIPAAAQASTILSPDIAKT